MIVMKLPMAFDKFINIRWLPVMSANNSHILTFLKILDY